MGQYHKIVNLDKKQFLHPHAFGDGLKLMEFGMSGQGTLSALTVLLAAHNGRGSGDFHGDDPSGLIGSWAGDRIAIVGDYGDGDGDRFSGVYSQCANGGDRPGLEAFEDVSSKVIALFKAAGEDIRTRSL